MDPVSMDILIAFAKMSSRSCMMLFLRPIKEYSLDLAKSLLEVPIVTHMVLEGLSMDDVEQIIVCIHSRNLEFSNSTLFFCTDIKAFTT